MPEISRLMREHDRVCTYCNFPIKRARTKTASARQNDATREHKVPKSQDGSNLMPNIGLACRFCNELRGSFLDAHVFRSVIQSILRDTEICDKWHRLNEAETLAVRTKVWQELAAHDPGFAKKVRHHFGKEGSQ